MSTPKASTPKAAPSWADQAADRIRRLSGQTARCAVAAGRIILDARAKLPPGEFQPWLESLPFGRTTAHKLIRVAVVFGHRDRSQCERIELSALYELAAPSCPAKAREAALELAAAGEVVTHERAAELISSHRPPDDPTVRGRFNGAESPPAVAVLRGALIDAMDASFRGGAVGRWLWQPKAGLPPPETRKVVGLLREAPTEKAALAVLEDYGREIFVEIMKAWFPEEFCEPGAYIAPGVFPDAGPRRVGAERLEEVAAAVRGRAG